MQTQSQAELAALACAAAAMHPELAQSGFLHLKGVVPEDQIQELKALAKTHGASRNVHATPVFDFLVERLAVHKLVRSMLGEEVYYFGWSTIRPGDKAQRGGYHDDAKGLPVALDGPRVELFEVASAVKHDALKDPLWPIYRLFVYLDDHVDFSGGTKVRAGSHRRYSVFSKEGWRSLRRLRFGNLMFPGLGYANPRVRPGDAVLFNLKCKHAAHFVRFRWPLDRVALSAGCDNVIKKFWLRSRIGRMVLRLFVRDFHDARTSVVIDFCTDSDWSRGYQLNRLLYHNNRAWQEQFYDCNRAEFVRKLQKAGLPVLNNPSLLHVERFLRGQ